MRKRELEKRVYGLEAKYKIVHDQLWYGHPQSQSFAQIWTEFHKHDRQLYALGHPWRVRVEKYAKWLNRKRS